MMHYRLLATPAFLAGTVAGVNGTRTAPVQWKMVGWDSGNFLAVYPTQLKENMWIKGLPSLILGLLLTGVQTVPPETTSSSTTKPISIHPQSPKYFLFRGKPLALITATEHYGSVVNARFDFDRYFQ